MQQIKEQAGARHRVAGGPPQQAERPPPVEHDLIGGEEIL